MKKFLTLLVVLCLSSQISVAQCGNGSILVPGSLTPPGVGQSTSFIFNSGRYVLAYVQGGANYQVSTCGGSTGGGPTYDTQLTIYDDATGAFLGYNDDACSLQSSINFTPSFCGYVRILLHQYSCNGSNLPWNVTMTQNTAGTIQTYTQAAVTSQTNISCFGLTDGQAEVSVTGTTGAVRYSWTPTGGTNALATGLSPGVYTVTVSDAACKGTIQTFTITQPNALLSTSTHTNVRCFGASNGLGSVSVTGGTTPYTYTWSPSGGNAAISSGLPAGSYTNNITDARGCTTSSSVSITEPTALTTSTAISNNLCFGGSAGSATVTASGGTGAYTYTWSTGASTSVITGQISGVKTVTVTDANGCISTNTVTITEPAIGVSSSTAVTNVLCNGNSTGSATVTAIGGTAGYTYLWSTSATASVITGQSAGIKTVTVTDANGCTTSNTVIISQPATAVTSSTLVGGVLCNGGSTGSATVIAIGGTPGYTYLWSTAATSSVITGQNTGVRTVTVTDANGCTNLNTVNIIQPSALVTSTAVTNILCNGNSTGSGTVTASGGTGAYSYLWSTGATGSFITGQPVGVKTVTVTDANGCASTITVNITQPATAVSSSTAVTNILCRGNGTGSATVTASGGTGAYTYLWSTASTASVITGQTAGVKTVTVTDANGCAVTNAVTITEPATGISTSTAVTNVLCNSNSTGSATITASGGIGAYTYLWSTTATSSVITGQTAGVKTVTVTDANGCAIVSSVTISQPATAVSSSTVVTNVLCFGESTGSATITASGGTGAYTYLWSTGATTSVITGQPVGIRTVIVTDANGCISTNTVTISQPATAVSSSTAVTNILCRGNGTGSATVTASGGTGAYTYLWSTAATTSVITGQSMGVVTVTVTDANGCTVTNTVTITEPATGVTSTTLATHVLCFGESTGSATVTASGGTGIYTYLWSTTATTSVITGQMAGVKTVTVTDLNGCAVTNTVTITEPATSVSSSTAVTNVLCFGESTGSATITASGGTGSYTYLWSTAATTSVITSEPAGVKTVTVTDANGCISTNTITISQPATAVTSSTSVTNVLCNGNSTGSATVTASGGTGAYTYLWSTASTASVITSQSMGVVTVTVTDANGCAVTNTVTITEPATGVTSTTLETHVLCFGENTGSATVTANGGTGTYTYLWSTAATNSVITAEPAGVKTVTVTDANGCISTNTVIITEPATALSATQTQTNVTCVINGMASVSASGGTGPYTYTWSPTGGNAATSTTLTAGNYTVTITDFNSCTVNQLFTITANTINPVVAVSGSSVICNGSTVTLTVSGADTYVWDSGATTSTVTVSPTATTIYSVTGTTTINGCSSSETHTITVNPNPTLTITASSTVICSTQSATLTAGGAGAYTWSTGSNATSIVVTPTATTDYTLDGSFVTGCSGTETISITVVNTPTVTAVSTSSAICAGSSATLTANGANTYSWSTGATGSSIIVSPLANETYSVNGMVGAGCNSDATVSVVVNANPTLSISVSQASVCAGNSTTLTASGASSYTWSSGSNAISITSTPTVLTSYTVTGSNAEGCTNTATQTIGLFPDPAINISSSSASVCIGYSSTLTASGVSTYSWNTGSNNASITVTPTTTTNYLVDGTDSNGCAASNSITIGVNTSPTLSAVASNTAICEGESSNLSVSGASSYVWSTGDVGASITVSPVVTTVYSVTGTSGAGCVSSTTVSVLLYVTPTVSIGADIEIALGTSYQFNASQSGATSFSWTPTTYLNSGAILNPLVTPENDITYILTVSSSDGCTASDTVNVIVLKDLIIANYMSPNGDGQNDTWKVNVPDLIKDYSITIMDGYGKIVFSVASNYSNEFDGKLGGQDLPDGVYYYFIKSGNDTKFKGNITITK